MNTLLDVLRHHAAATPDAVAFSFLDDGEMVGAQLTFAQLDEQARAVAATLQQLCKPGDRAVLLYPPSLDFVVAFMGCQYAGVIAVPALPPNLNRVRSNLDHLAGIVTSAEPAMILTTSAMSPPIAMATRSHRAFSGVRIQATDRIDPRRAAFWSQPAPKVDDLAFLQYTSGSTSAPKGVMISHANILTNLAMIRETVIGRRSADTRYHMVGWLPQFHDMGLIGVVLHGLFVGTETCLMSPVSFLKRPVRWLRAIAKYGHVCSGAPNFALELCLSRIRQEEKVGLDLSGWEVSFCGAETVRADTLERFYQAFAGCGLRREALLPCYGLAEATLIVSGRTPGASFRTLDANKEELARGCIVPERSTDERGSTQRLVSCGSTKGTQEILIVDPDTTTPCPDGKVGEIWVRGGNVGRGYWRDPERSAEVFEARTSTGDGPFLRTGDLGFMLDGELHVTGRIKELILVHGRCVYPQDLEHAIASLSEEFPELSDQDCVAFALPAGPHRRREGIGLLAQVRPRRASVRPEALIEAIQARLFDQFELHLDEIALVRTSVPRTSSGKKRRAACASLLERGDVDELGLEHLWRSVQNSENSPKPADRLSNARPVVGQARLSHEIAEWLAKELGVEPETISTSQPLSGLALDSLVAVSLIDFLEQRLQIVLPSTLLNECRTIDSLAARLVKPATTGVQICGE